MTIFNKVQAKVDTRIQEIAEIISELRDPLYSTQTQDLQQQPSPQQQQLEEQQTQHHQLFFSFAKINICFVPNIFFVVIS